MFGIDLFKSLNTLWKRKKSAVSRIHCKRLIKTRMESAFKTKAKTDRWPLDLALKKGGLIKLHLNNHQLEPGSKGDNISTSLPNRWGDIDSKLIRG